MKNLLVAQSGGPSSAINATLAGIIKQGLASHDIDTVYGGVNGIEGILCDHLINLTTHFHNADQLSMLCQTPASALGSCRFKLKSPAEDDTQYKKIISVFRKFNIAYFIYIGGNDSMDTVNKLSQYLTDNHITDLIVVGAPKTIDNDLAETDHCPGFGSAAKFVATSIAEIERDIAVYRSASVAVVEVMGRNAGWLTASAALARVNGGRGASLIYLCERTFDPQQFIADIRRKLKQDNSVVVAVSEGIRDKTGCYVSESPIFKIEDAFGHIYLSGVGKFLEQMVRGQIGCKVRSIELNLLQRAAAHTASKRDLEESFALGEKAVQTALEGKCGYMAAMKRLSNDPYQVELTTVHASLVANNEKKVPLEWITKEGNDVTEPLIAYLKPLIHGECTIEYDNGIPKHVHLY